MKTNRWAAPATARPLAPLAVTLVILVSLHAAIVGCSGQKTDTSTESSTSTPPASPTAAAPVDTGAGGGTMTAGAGDVTHGAAVYKQRCVLCHGPEGKGDGPGAAGLNPKPRNHTDGAYMNSRTDEQLLEVIRNGKGQMPAWGKTKILSEQDMRDVLAYVRTLAK